MTKKTKIKNKICILMINTVKKAVSAIIPISCFLFLSVHTSAETTETIPMLSREYIQQNYETVASNRGYTVLITVLSFAAAAIAIPIVFSIIKKIAAVRAKNTSVKKKSSGR